MASNRIRLITFDALHTLVKPREPIPVQYSKAFQPYLGILDPNRIKTSFKVALKQLQAEKPAYSSGGAEKWWGDVVKRTAVGAGAEVQAVEDHLDDILPILMNRFSTREGYSLFDDTLPLLTCLRNLKIQTALVSNADSRMRLVLEDLGVLEYLNPVVLSEEQGIEKPAPEMFLRAIKDVRAEHCIHVGDELENDYYAATRLGMHALLLRRPGADGDEEVKEASENIQKVRVVGGLLDVLDVLQRI